MKRIYRIRNWPEYNRALQARGNITLWFSEEAIKKWHNPPHNFRSCRPRVYSDDAILCLLLIRTVYHLPLRALCGFLLSIVTMLELKILVPSASQICRRARDLDKELLRLTEGKTVADIVFDSTGLKVYGEGEWKVRQHGVSKRRTWRKIHIGVDPNSQEIIISELTENGTGNGDGQVAEEMLKDLEGDLNRVYGDGAYDGKEFREAVERKGAEPIIPPPRNAVVHGARKGALLKRDNAVKEIRGLGGDEGGRSLWKILKGYHMRSLAETAMYRIKQITGGMLRSREWIRQKVEAKIKCKLINIMTKLGMPKGEWVLSG